MAYVHPIDSCGVHKVTVHTFQDIEEGKDVIAAFPSVGLVGTVTAKFLIDELKLKQVGVMDSPRFPTLSVVENGEPMNPVRIYAAKGQPIVILSEFQPHPDLVRPIGEAIMDWARKIKGAAVIAPEGLLQDDDAELMSAVAASTQKARDRLESLGATLFEEGIVAGVTGVVLNLGRRDQFPTIAILSDAIPGQPDARSASDVVAIIAQWTGAKLDSSKLLDEAEAFDASTDEVERRLRLQEGKAEAADSSMFG